MICYAFPTVYEAQDLLKASRLAESFFLNKLHCTVANYRNRRVLIVILGMGLDQAEENAVNLFHFFRPKVVILAGYGGALISQLKRGQIVLSNNYSSEAVLPFVRLLSGFDFANFCSSRTVVSTPAARETLALSQQSQVVDMETSAVADVARARNCPFVAIRAISDEYQDILPTGALSAAFDPEQNKATPLRLFVYFLLHPGEIGSFQRFVSGLGAVRRSLTHFLAQLTDELPGNW